MKNILVTGGAGYIGSHIVEKLIEMRKKVFIIDNLSTGYKKLINKKAHFFHCDIKNVNKLDKIIKNCKISSVIHLAANLSVGEGEKKPKKYYLNNVLGTKNIIKCCLRYNIKNLIFSSTCAVYKDKLKTVKESSQLNPISIYGKTKFLAEKAIKKNFNKKNINYAILRYFNIAGASSSNKIGEINSSHGHLFKNIAIQSLKKKPVINIYGADYKTKDGTCVRDYMHVSDLSVAHVKALEYLKEKSKSIILNCGYGKGYSVLEILRILKKIKKNLKINFVQRRKGDVAAVYSDTKKFKKTLKMKIKYNSINKILKSSINWEKILKSRK